MLPHKLSDRLRLIQWLLPVIVMAVATVYQLGPARYVHNNYGAWAHYWLEILFYGTAGPVFLWFTFRVVRVWVEQKEQAEAEVYRLNSELQQRVEERTLELKKKADALEAANAQLQELDQIKSEFVSLVSHEFRAPLTNMRGALELMGGNCTTLNSTCTRMVGIVNAEVSRLGRLVEGVLNISRIEAGELQLVIEAVDIVKVANQVLDEFAARNVERNLQRPHRPSHPMVLADPDRLHQVIANLVDNAVKYSPKNSEISLSVNITGREGILIVTDNGPGIPLEEQPRLFQRFSRLDSGDNKETYGYGLGLYLCRRLIEGMNGKIWVESQAGQGATFLFALPLVESSGLQHD
jgi:signal transduction histidine kinase